MEYKKKKISYLQRSVDQNVVVYMHDEFLGVL